MRIIIKKIIAFLIVVSNLLLSGCVMAEIVAPNLSLKLTEDKEDVRLNNEVFEKYMDSMYGVINNEFKKSYIGYITPTQMRGVKGNVFRSWIRAYQISAPFMSKPFEVWIDNRTHDIFGDNFYDTLQSDEKFQHLYSDWVKKQIGCEDENLKLKFTGNYNNDFTINFNNIEALDKEYNELFKNIKGYYIRFYYKSHIIELNNTNKYEIANEIKLKYSNKIISITGLPNELISNGILLSSNDFDRKKDTNFRFAFNPKNLDEELIEEHY